MRLNRTNERRGIILLVVLSLLALFAIVGVTFVLYADSEAASARVAREAEVQQRPDVDPQQALAYFLGQLIYDVNDNAAGAASGLRGHSLARTLYGYNYAAIGTPGVNIIPFNGTGRLHYPSQFAQDDYTLVNYTWFSADGFVRDPERYGTRGNPGVAQANFYVGGNAPYTYPDLNNFFLAAVKADGTVLTPSFHRPWLFNPGKAFNDMTNPNWTNAQGKYLTLRPRPAEHPNFPPPDDATGDVKNLVWAPGGNDSIWIDPGGPVMTAPDGTLYKMLFAPLIMDLDGRINLNTAGNMSGPGNSHVSNQGWGASEVNLAKVLYGDNANSPTQYTQLFLSNTLTGGNTIYGRYGSKGTPSTPGNSINSVPGVPITAGLFAHSYAQSDANGLNENTPPYSSRPAPPGFAPNVPNMGTPPPSPMFPQFLQGYLNGSGAEPTNHPLLYNVFQPSLPYTVAPLNALSTRVFRPIDMEPLLRPNSLGTHAVDSGSAALMTDLIRLSPSNFGTNATSPRFQNLVTTLSMDLGVPGVSPYWWNGMNPATAYLTMNPNPMLAPLGTAAPFPTLPPSYAVTPNPNFPNAAPVPPPPSEFGTDWRAVSANPANYSTNNPFAYTSPGGRIRLNRPLPPYPHMGAGAIAPYATQVPNAPSPYGVAYNLTQAPIQNQYAAALNARQSLANDIYRRLLALAGVTPVAAANTAAPLSTDLAPRRWLAQLAVNIVDFIDEDDISTPFNFYNTLDGLAAANIGATQGNDDPGAPVPPTNNNSGNNTTGANPLYWVFGTEMPKVVLNEVVAQAQNPTGAAAPAGVTITESVKLWIELFNTMPGTVAANTQPQDSYRVPLYVTNPAGGGYSPYRLTITQNLMLTGAMAPLLPDTSANVLGKANIVAPFPQSTTDVDFSAVVPLSQGLTTPPPATPPTQAPFTVPVSGNTINAGVDPQNFFLIGPKTIPANPNAANTNPPYQNPFVTPGLPTGIPVLQTDSVSYTPTWNPNVAAAVPPPNDERITGLTVLLRRLANPYLPFNPNPVNGMGVVDPTYNPYVTVDYVTSVPIQSNLGLLQNPLPNPLPTYNTRGKTQPYAALTQLVPPAMGVPPNPQNVQATSPVVNQIVLPAGSTAPPAGATNIGNVINTFGYTNYPLPPSGHYDWLAHLDRPVISPMELLHVSAWPPYMLTQQFMLGADNVATSMFGHYAPWLDAPLPPAAIANVTCPWWFDTNLTAGQQSHRLYRLLEFLECGDRAFGVNGLGRIPGKVNINTIWDAEILQALIDANPSIGITVNPPGTPTVAGDPVANIFANLLTLRSPNGAPGMTGVTGATDRPFLPLSVGLNPAGTTQFPTNATAFTTIGTSVNTDTVLRMSPTNQQLLFQNPADTSAVHPYLQTQLLTKLYNNVTTRSNTFAVFVTVGFFQVTNPGTTPPTLGAEIGRSEGRQIRHRMFALVDRTNLSVFSTTSGVKITGPTIPTPASPMIANNPFGNQTIVVGSLGSIGVGSQLVIEPGTANEETVVVQSVIPANPTAVPPVPPQFTANFLLAHPNTAITGNPSATYQIIMRGNPGPQANPLTPYDPRNDSLVVPYFSIID
jgi:hypothetical protein